MQKPKSRKEKQAETGLTDLRIPVTQETKDKLLKQMESTDYQRLCDFVRPAITALANGEIKGGIVGGTFKS